MEDEYQVTLKGKIKILFQLEKWQDVIKLGKQYNEKYGKDVEIDMMRFKSERRLGKTVPAEENKARIATSENQAEESFESLDSQDLVAAEEPPILLTADHEAVENPTMLVINEVPAADTFLPAEEKMDDEPFTEANELIITDPYAEDNPPFIQPADELVKVKEPSPEANKLVITDPYDEAKPAFIQPANEPYVKVKEPAPEDNELIITDPFDEDKPVFSLADNEPPVILVDSGKTEKVPIQTEPRAEEKAIVEEGPSEIPDTEIAFDYSSNPAIIFNADPTLTPEPPAEPISIQIDDEEKKLPAESAAAESAAVDLSAKATDEASVAKVNAIAPEPKVEPAAIPINEPNKTLSADSFMEMAYEKPLPVSEPYNALLKKTKPSKKFAFNLKYFLILVLPLAAAVILWLALSGKLNLDNSAAENVSPVSVVKTPGLAVQRPAREVIPATPIPQVDEKEKLVSEKISQANGLIKNNDILKALAVVLEAKKIKDTEALRQLENVITKKIREDESRAAEQKLLDQNAEPLDAQAYAKAEAINTLAAWQNFILQYPQGEFTVRVRKKITELEKQAQKNDELLLQQKVQQMQKIKLRSAYTNLNQVELSAVLQHFGKLSTQFEQIEHGGEKVVIDYATGLMWTLWNKPMVYDKARWWANRIYAGYAGWRLPTVEESLSLLQMEPARYSGLADFVVWTGDEVSDQARSSWALRLPQGQFVPGDEYQVYYVWAVRKAGK